MVEIFKKVTGAAHVHVFHHQLRATKDNADGNGFNTSVQPYAMPVHCDSSRHAANAVDAKFCKGRFVYINAWRNITTDPVENNHLAVCDETSLVAPDDYLASDLFMPGARLMQYGLSDHNAAKHRWYCFPKMQMDEVLLFKQFDSDTWLPGRMTFHTAFVDPTVRPDAPCTAGTPFRRINEKLGAETGDLAMTYKLVVAAVGLCRHAVRIGGGFSWEWSYGNEFWNLVVVRNLFARCGS